VKRRAVAALKRGLVKLGRLAPPRVLYDLNGVVNYLEVGAFARDRGFAPRHTAADKWGVFDAVAAEAGARQVLYLEFGVAAGASMRRWSRLLSNPASVLHGFDSFEGLPTDWILDVPAGHFSTDGKPPEIEDERVAFFPGWFDRSLPGYAAPEHDLLIVNVDADLYSSTVTVLEKVEPWLAPGSFVYFDEFNHRGDEMRAFGEFLDRTGLGFELFAASDDLAHVAFRRIASPR
jgi:O-methyltransferase